MELRIIDAAIMDQFVKNNPYNHYKKTSYWAHYEMNQVSPHYLGYYCDGLLIATALLLEHKSIMGSYFYLPLGPCMDYEDSITSLAFLKEIIAYAQKRNPVFLRMDPNVVRVSRDIQGNQTPEINHEEVTDYLKELGFQHKGYGYAYNGSWSNRYTLVIDLTPPLETIISRFSKSKQNVLKRQTNIGVKTRSGNEADLIHLMAFEKELASTQKFKPHSKEFFLHYLNTFQEYAHLYVTELHVDEMIDYIGSELNSGKYRKDPEARLAKEKELKNALEWKGQYGDIIPIAAGLFLHYGFKSWDLYTYNAKAFNSLKPTDSLHTFAIQDLKSLGVTFYDMCGFSGVTNKEDRYYGLYDYKKSFGSVFTEYIGEFDYIFKPQAFNRFQLWNKIKLRLRYYFKRVGIY